MVVPYCVLLLNDRLLFVLAKYDLENLTLIIICYKVVKGRETNGI